MRKTMVVPKLKKTMRGHCEKCGGAIRRSEHHDGFWYQCNECGMWQERLGYVKHDHDAVAVGKTRKQAGVLSHRQARRLSRRAA